MIYNQLPTLSSLRYLQIQMNTEFEEEDDTLLEEMPFTEPPLYAVIMLNDDYTTMDFVVHILTSEFNHDEAKAMSIMFDIHEKGQGVAGVYSKDIADTKSSMVNDLAKMEGFPLMTIIEPLS